MIRSWGEKRRGGGGEGEVSIGLDGKRPPDCGLTADHPPDTHTHEATQSPLLFFLLALYLANKKKTAIYITKALLRWIKS